MATPVIASIQTGSVTFDNAGTTVPITSVDSSKSILLFEANPAQSLMSPFWGELTSDTLITFTGSGGQNNNKTVNWRVIEFSEGVSVQRGTITPNTSTTATLSTAVTLAQSILIPGGQDAGDNNYLAFCQNALELTNSTTVTWQGFDNTRAEVNDFKFQVVEFDSASDADVQRDSTTISNGNASATQAITEVTDTAATMIIVQPHFETGSSPGNGSPDELGIQATFNSTTEIQFDRSGTNGQIQVDWQVVELPSAESLQTVDAALTTAETVDTLTISSVDTDNAFIIPQSWALHGGGEGLSAGNDADDFGCATARFALASATSVTATRTTVSDGSGDSRALDATAYVVEYAAGAGSGSTSLSDSVLLNSPLLNSPLIR